MSFLALCLELRKNFQIKKAMVQDYFSLYSKDKTFLLLRIHHKVDFSDEIAWSHCWDLAKEDCFDEITEKIFSYLIQGFDCIDSW